jgi:poly-gamma-glutamate synthesis protein (capsule biosynthesis protein)
MAWISCATHTNGISDPYHQVLYCYRSKDRQWIMDTIRNLKNKVDFIIVMPHWGEQYEYLPNQTQKEFAHSVLDAGASVVLGSHPHVLQPFEKYLTKDGRSTAIMYSLGNFVSFQGTANNRTSVILILGFTKNNRGAFINGMRFVPIFMQNRSGFHQMQLIRIPNDHSLPSQIVSRVLPMANVLYSNKIITNPECD